MKSKAEVAQELQRHAARIRQLVQQYPELQEDLSPLEKRIVNLVMKAVFSISANTKDSKEVA